MSNHQQSSTEQSFLFGRWPRWAALHPWRTLLATAIVLGCLGGLYVAFGGDYAERFSVPGTEAQRAFDLLKERFPQTAGDSATVVVKASSGLDEPHHRQQVNQLLADLAKLPGVVSVSSPYEQSGALSTDGSIGQITVQYSQQAFEIPKEDVKALLDLRKQASTNDLQVEVGGQVARSAEQEPPGSSTLIGIGAAVLILLIAFGSVVAMGIPILTALIALASGFLLIGVTASFFDMPRFTPEFAAMIGIGVGIDYALLVVTRFREGLAIGLQKVEAIVTASRTAGRSVLFAGSAVVIALLGLWAVGIPLVAYVGTAGAVVVGFAALVAILVLPAILSLAGGSIDRWRLPGLSASAHESETGVGYRLSRLIQKAPLLFLGVSLAILVALALPVTDLNLGVSDSGNNPESFTSRRAYDLLSEGFGSGFNGPLLLAARIDDQTGGAAVERLAQTLRAIEGVASVAAPRFNEERTAATILVIPTTTPQSQKTEQLVQRIRSQIGGSAGGAQVFVGGPTATFIDLGDKLSQRMPFFFAAVIGLSFLLLMAVFRSVLVPLKAACLNLLSVGAAYGVLVAVFQWGWFGSLFGVHRTGPIESFLPIMLFAVLFGLSMDYEVFLISRIREEYLHHGNNTEAVARGLSVTTRVITAAAAIMVAVFASFALGDQRIIKEFGVGLASAIFLDATLVRLVLVPSLMQLLGDANWWFPSWLDRLVPRIGFEAGERAPAYAAAPNESHT